MIWRDVGSKMNRRRQRLWPSAPGFLYVRKHCQSHTIPRNFTGNPVPQAPSHQWGKRVPYANARMSAALNPIHCACILPHPFQPCQQMKGAPNTRPARFALRLRPCMPRTRAFQLPCHPPDRRTEAALHKKQDAWRAPAVTHERPLHRRPLSIQKVASRGSARKALRPTKKTGRRTSPLSLSKKSPCEKAKGLLWQTR